MPSEGSFIPLGVTLCTQGAESLWRRVIRLKDSRGYFNSKNLDYFRIAGILIWRGFNIFQKNETPDFWTIFKVKQGVSSRNFTLIFGIPKFRSILKPREFELEGVSLLSLKLSVLKELSHFQGELQSEKSPRLSNSKNLDYFKIAGILIWRGFRV